MNLSKWKKKVLIITGVAIVAIYNAGIPSLSMYNKLGEADTVVFTNGRMHISGEELVPNSLVARIVDYFMYPPITLRENIKGRKVDWRSNATSEQVLDDLANPQYNNVVLIGHGSASVYETSDGLVTAEDIVREGIPKKYGELRQHTCSESDGSRLTLRETLLTDPSKGYSFDGLVTVGKNYLKAWKVLFK